MRLIQYSLLINGLSCFLRKRAFPKLERSLTDGNAKLM